MLHEHHGNLIQHFILLKGKDKSQSISGYTGMEDMLSLRLCVMPGKTGLCPNGSGAALCSKPSKPTLNVSRTTYSPCSDV